MRKIKTVFGIIAFLLMSCSTTNVGKPSMRKTENPNIPIVYTNGFKDYTLKSLLTVDNNDSIYITELRFNAVESAMYTQKLMYDRFGKWTKEIKQEPYKNPTLLWENVKLYDNQNKYYTVAANGIESDDNLYAAVMVYDADNNDCLSSNSPEQQAIINYFSEGIKNLSTSETFYQLYHQQFDKN